MKRFEPTQFNDSGMVERPNGDFVLYADYERLRLMTAALLSEAAIVYRKYNDTQQPDGDLVDFQTLHEVQEVLE